MRFGLYVFSILILVGSIFIFTYIVNPNEYTMEMMGGIFVFPVAVWVTIPMLILFLFTVIHLFFYASKHYFLFKKWEKDIKTLEDGLYYSLLNEPKEQSYLIDEVEKSAKVLSKASLHLLDNIDGLTPKLSHIINIVRKIKSGEYVDLKEEKLSDVFEANNPLLIANRLNRINSDETFPQEVMKSPSDYSPQVQAQALKVFASKANFTDAKVYIDLFDVPSFLLMLARINDEEHLELTSEILIEFIETLPLSCKDFIAVASITKKYLRPDENLGLFNSLQSKNEKAQNAYLYLLFEYELIEQVGIYLEEQDENDFLKFRAFYHLKKENSKYRLEDIIDIYAVCSKVKYY